MPPFLNTLTNKKLQQAFLSSVEWYHKALTHIQIPYFHTQKKINKVVVNRDSEFISVALRSWRYYAICLRLTSVDLSFITQILTHVCFFFMLRKIPFEFLRQTYEKLSVR